MNLEEWIKRQDFKTTKEIEVPSKLVGQVIGQDEAVEVVKKAAEQKRHALLIGEPGTGKSMLARAMSELLPKEELQDIVTYPNRDDPHCPLIKVTPATKGREIVNRGKKIAMQRRMHENSLMLMIIVMIIGMAVIWAIHTSDYKIVIFAIIACAFIFWIMSSRKMRRSKISTPKLLISRSKDTYPPFIDATGAHAGALLGDVRHDPFQAGGLETPAHERVEIGAIHRAHKGVLFIDEINTLRIESQQNLLTALQEKEFSITGQSERSAGAMVKTEPVPCDFILVVAGGLEGIKGMHPALRSRIRGYGYEVYMRDLMEDTPENRRKVVRFVAQEVRKDKKIPHFNKSAVLEIIREAQRRAGRAGKLTLRLRELGGLIRVAGDVAVDRYLSKTKERKKEVIESAKENTMVGVDDVLKAKKVAKSLEQQVAGRYIEKRKEYRSFATIGKAIGRVNGLAIMGADTGISEYSGVVLPIAAEVTPAHSRAEGKIIATGKLGKIAKEAVQNVSALIKKYTGKDISNHDVHIQFIGTYEGVEGDSASISVATAVISALENVGVDQSMGLTGSLSVRGEVLPVGGITAKIEAAADAGLRKILIPKRNAKDVLIEDKYKNKIEILPVSNLKDVLSEALVGEERKRSLLAKLAKLVSKVEELDHVEPGVA